MTTREAYALAAKLWRTDATLELLHRGRKSPRFKVGYADLGTGRTVTMGTSDVDWESAVHERCDQGKIVKRPAAATRLPAVSSIKRHRPEPHQGGTGPSRQGHIDASVRPRSVT